MGELTLPGVLLTPLKQILGADGEVRHGIKAIDAGFAGFGEAYFSSVNQHAVKGWKRHFRMTLNLVVVIGRIHFMVRDDAGAAVGVDLSPDAPETYARLTVPPGFWMAFGGAGEDLNLLLNVANLVHDPSESETRPIADFDWSW